MLPRAHAATRAATAPCALSLCAVPPVIAAQDLIHYKFDELSGRRVTHFADVLRKILAWLRLPLDPPPRVPARDSPDVMPAW